MNWFSVFIEVFTPSEGVDAVVTGECEYMYMCY